MFAREIIISRVLESVDTGIPAFVRTYNAKIESENQQEFRTSKLECRDNPVQSSDTYMASAESEVNKVREVIVVSTRNACSCQS